MALLLKFLVILTNGYFCVFMKTGNCRLWIVFIIFILMEQIYVQRLRWKQSCGYANVALQREMSLIALWECLFSQRFYMLTDNFAWLLLINIFSRPHHSFQYEIGIRRHLQDACKKFYGVIKTWHSICIHYKTDVTIFEVGNALQTDSMKTKSYSSSHLLACKFTESRLESKLQI